MIQDTTDGFCLQDKITYVNRFIGSNIEKIKVTLKTVTGRM